MNHPDVGLRFRRIMDTCLKMHDGHIAKVESVVTDRFHDFILDIYVGIPDGYIVDILGEFKDVKDSEQYQPAIRRLKHLVGTKIGPGLLNQVKQCLGEELDCGFIVDALVEAARATKQLNDSYLRRIPEDLDPADAKALRNFEMIVRQDLRNSCIPYKDGIEESFAEKNVSVSVRMDLYFPRPGQVNRFRRDKVIEILILTDCIHLQEYMTDDSHEIEVDICINKENSILAAKAYPFRVPYTNLCNSPFERMDNLIGLSADGQLNKTIRALIGGSEGCTHLADMVIDCIRYYNYVTHKTAACLINDTCGIGTQDGEGI